MKIKNYLETLTDNANINGVKGLFGKELKILEPYFEYIDEFKGKKIEIIDELNPRSVSNIEITNNGVNFQNNTESNILTVKDINSLKENIKLYSIMLQNDEVIIRCSDDSIIS